MISPDYLRSANSLATRSHEEMRDVLKNTDAPGPEIHYYMIRGGSDKKNITLWESGTVGDEYIKTYGHYHVDKLDETYEVLFGKAILLLQSRELDNSGLPIDDSLSEVKAIYMGTGQKILIPGNMGHLMVNIGPTWLVTADDSPVSLTLEEKASWPAHADYSPIKNLKGFGYYVIKTENGPEFVKNPNYKVVPDLVIEKL